MHEQSRTSPPSPSTPSATRAAPCAPGWRAWRPPASAGCRWWAQVRGAACLWGGCGVLATAGRLPQKCRALDVPTAPGITSCVSGIKVQNSPPPEYPPYLDGLEQGVFVEGMWGKDPYTGQASPGAQRRQEGAVQCCAAPPPLAGSRAAPEGLIDVSQRSALLLSHCSPGRAACTTRISGSTPQRTPTGRPCCARCAQATTAVPTPSGAACGWT